MEIYKAINRVQKTLCIDGISKSRKNQQQGYSFRGIDDVLNAVSPALAEHGVCIFPRVIKSSVAERMSRNGGAMFYTTLRVAFDFVSSADGSIHTAIMIGEAMDSADKSSNKAMSAAYKYACIQVFAIPTEGDNDADAYTPDVIHRSQHPDVKREAPAVKLKTVAEYVADIKAADSQEWLKGRYIEIYKELKDYPNILAEVTAAKDAKKVELEGVQNEQSNEQI